MAKYKLIRGVSKEKLEKVIPQILVRYVAIPQITDEIVNVAIFPSDTKHVVISGHTRSLLEEIENLRPILVVGSSFTQEAASGLREKADYFFCKNDNFWTDGAYLNTNSSTTNKGKR